MDRLDMEFFDKYKDVDKFCGEMLSSDSGISEYIDQMEKTPASKRRYVPSWERDYRMLKHLRYVRNQIAHANNDVISTEEDFFELNEFYDRLLSGNHPFALIRINSKRAERISKHSGVKNDGTSNTEHTGYSNYDSRQHSYDYDNKIRSTDRNNYNHNSTNYGKNSGSPLKILALSAFVIAVLLIAYYMSQ